MTIPEKATGRPVPAQAPAATSTYTVIFLPAYAAAARTAREADSTRPDLPRAISPGLQDDTRDGVDDGYDVEHADSRRINDPNSREREKSMRDHPSWRPRLRLIRGGDETTAGPAPTIDPSAEKPRL